MSDTDTKPSMTVLLDAVKWVMEMEEESSEEFFALPGMNPTSDNFLFVGLNQDSYEAFAINPPVTAIKGGPKNPRAQFVNVRVAALHNYFWGVRTGSDPGDNTPLEHPKEAGVTPSYFVKLYMTDVYKKLHYSEGKFTSPKLAVIAYDGEPKNFEKYYASLKASAANASPDMVRCMETRQYAMSVPDMNMTLYNWAMGTVDQFSAQLYFWPNYGDGNAALKALSDSPGVVSFEDAKKSTSKKVLQKLKCFGTNLTWFFDRFNVLVIKAGITSEKDIKEYMKEAFEKESPYYEVVNRLLCDKAKSSKEIIVLLHEYYASHVCLTEKDTKLYSGVPLREADEVYLTTTPNPTVSNRKKRKARDAPKGHGDVTPKGASPKKKFGGAPKIVKEDYLKLSEEERTELRTEGKVKGYHIFKSKDEPGSSRCVKEGTKTSKIRRVANVVTNEGHAGDSDGDESSFDDITEEQRKGFEAFYGSAL